MQVHLGVINMLRKGEGFVSIRDLRFETCSVSTTTCWGSALSSFKHDTFLRMSADGSESDAQFTVYMVFMKNDQPGAHSRLWTHVCTAMQIVSPEFTGLCSHLTSHSVCAWWC